MVYKRDEFSCTSHKILIREKEEEMAEIVPVVKRAKKLWLLFPTNQIKRKEEPPAPEMKKDDKEGNDLLKEMGSNWLHKNFLSIAIATT